MMVLVPGPRADLYEHVWDSEMFTDWHWLAFNFDRKLALEDRAASLIIDALVTCDEAMPGFGHDMVDRVASMGGKQRNEDDFESIRQWLAELLVVHHLVSWAWPTGTTFEHEPTTTKGGANPEMIIRSVGLSIGIEVKCPDLRKHQIARRINGTQLLARVREIVDSSMGGTTPPRDNPIKDFLSSCELKFSQFRVDPDFRSLLFIVWDDFVNEPISALLSPISGLLTGSDFATASDGFPFSSTDAVVILRHQHQFERGIENREPMDERQHFLDYGAVGCFPHNALIINPAGKNLPDGAIEATQALVPDPVLGAEYTPSELVWWMDV